MAKQRLTGCIHHSGDEAELDLEFDAYCEKCSFASLIWPIAVAGYSLSTSGVASVFSASNNIQNSFVSFFACWSLIHSVRRNSNDFSIDTSPYRVRNTVPELITRKLPCEFPHRIRQPDAP